MPITLLDYLENTANKFPNKIAYVDNEKQITYNELLKKSKIIASNLLHYNKQPIVIYMDKTIDSISCMLGTITSGNFYTIIDIKMPQERLNKILEVLKPSAVITNTSLLQKTTSLFNNIEVIEFEKLSNEINENKLKQIKDSIIDTDPVYTLFTSGSTGLPKGYIINHKSVIDFCEAMTTTFEINENDVFANQSPFYFDLSISDIYCNIKNGSTTYLVPQSLFMFPTKIVEYLNKNKINAIFWVPSAISLTASALNNEVPKYLTKVLFCGEVMPNKTLNIWRKYLPNVMYANLYGPAETVDASTYYIVKEQFNDDDSLPIGKPFRNTGILVLDDNNKLITEPDEIGELYIKGSSLAMGYYNDSTKTNENFIQNPLNDKYLEIIYKTGDLVKYNHNNDLIYVCRKDYQIKHMGYRIELGEIETAVSGINEIECNACVYDNINKKIVLFYKGLTLEKAQIIEELKLKLPNYMLPTEIKQIEEMPYNANGKIDRIKLMEKIGEK